jgi:hypothetical protein
MPEADFEKLGVFYLGRRYNLQQNSVEPELVLYDSRDLLTHAVCIGMTGSGKTGLCLDLIEEAAIDSIPVIAIDPKGDIGNIMLTFPALDAASFQPWVDTDEARREALSPEQFAAKQADKWKTGLAQWDQPAQRIQRLKDAAEFAIYTPGASYGIPVSVVRSFAAPPPEVANDGDSLRERVASTASSLLGLLGIAADPLRSREHILLANILQSTWLEGKDLTLPALIQLIQKPPFNQVGALDLDVFYPVADRFELAMLLNNLLASPGFSGWTQGQSLDIDALLYTPEGKPRVSVFSISHLDDAQRMFFVSLLLNHLLAWMRTQSGTASLRAIFYMDEIFGYFPPTANPPSKTPLLTLMKQARAFGLGCVLATQNPVDIDYKGLSNAGTWFIGRLQTERDKLRVLDGLEGAASNAGGGFDRASMDKLLSQLRPRVFMMNNVHQPQPVIFETRWSLSYLKGPLSRDDIKRLMAEKGNAYRQTTGNAAAPQAVASPEIAGQVAPAKLNGVPAAAASNPKPAAASNRPLLSPGVKEYFLPVRVALPAGASVIYRPKIYAAGNVRFVDAKSSTDTTLQYSLLADSPPMGMPAPDWDNAPPAKVWMEQLQDQPQDAASFAPLIGAMNDEKSYTAWSKQFVTWLYNSKKLTLFKSEATGEFSKPRETERDFRIRLGQAARESRDEAAARLKERYAPKLSALEDRLRRAQQDLERQQLQARDQQIQSAISVGATVLGAFMGMSRGRVTTGSIDRAASAARRVGRTARKQQDVEHAADTVQSVNQMLSELNARFQAEMSELQGKFDPLQTPLSQITIAPKKTNINVVLLCLAWAPFVQNVSGREIPAWIATDSTG